MVDRICGCEESEYHRKQSTFGKIEFHTAIDPYGKQYATCALVEFPNSDIQLDSPPQCYPIQPITWKFNEKIRTVSGELVTVCVTREQLPFQPGFPCTGHIAQGQTMISVLAYMHAGGFSA